MKEIIEVLLPLLKRAKIELSQLQNADGEFLSVEEMTPIIKKGVPDALQVFATEKQAEAVRRALESKQRDLKQKYNAPDGLDIEALFEHVVKETTDKTIAASAQDFSKTTLADLAKLMPHLAPEIQKNIHDQTISLRQELKDANEKYETFVATQTKQTHKSDVLKIAEKLFLEMNPAGLVSDANLRKQQIEDFLTLKVNPERVIVRDNDLIEIDETGEIVTDNVRLAPSRLGDKFNKLWVFGFNQVAAAGGAPPPSGGGVTVMGLSINTQHKIKTAFDKGGDLSAILNSMKGTNEEKAALEYVNKLATSED